MRNRCAGAGEDCDLGKSSSNGRAESPEFGWFVEQKWHHRPTAQKIAIWRGEAFPVPSYTYLGFPDPDSDSTSYVHLPFLDMNTGV